MPKDAKDRYFFGYFLYNGDCHKQKWVVPPVGSQSSLCIAKREITESEFQYSLDELVSKYPFSELGNLR